MTSLDMSYQPWSEKEIKTLSHLFRNDIPIEHISKILGRSPKAIEHALKNVLVQELVHSNARNVSAKYKLSYETLETELAPYKYNLHEDSNTRFLVVVGILVIYILVTTIGFMLT